MSNPPITGERIRACASRFRLGMLSAKRAVEIANERFDGDDELGVYWLNANSLAVKVGGDRAAWNDARARHEKAIRNSNGAEQDA